MNSATTSFFKVLVKQNSIFQK